MPSDPLDIAPPDPALEAMLRAACPAPTVAWSASLERELLPYPAARRRRLAGATVAACGLALVVAVAGLAGAGPLAVGGDDAAKAKPGCEVVYVTKVAPVGEIVRRPDGSVTVETSSKPVTHAQQRCR